MGTSTRRIGFFSFFYFAEVRPGTLT